MDVLYLTLQLFTLESGAVVGPVNWPLQAARFLALAPAIYEQMHTVSTLVTSPSGTRQELVTQVIGLAR